MKRKYRKRIRILIFIGLLGLAAAVLLCMLHYGMVSLNHPSKRQYPIQGVDVSSYQGDIDWEVLSRQGIDFAFIKATEGSGFQDARFAYNWENAGNYGLEIGAYHFFSFDSAGETQADNFINTVPKKEGALPPVVDVEFYGDKAKNPPRRDRVEPQLQALLDRLEAQYGKKPILYCTSNSYERYIQGSYSDNPVWIRDIFATPHLPDRRTWTFWQFTGHKRLKGYNGKEKCIDMNVFYGSKSDWESFTQG